MEEEELLDYGEDPFHLSIFRYDEEIIYQGSLRKLSPFISFLGSMEMNRFVIQNDKVMEPPNPKSLTYHLHNTHNLVEVHPLSANSVDQGHVT